MIINTPEVILILRCHRDLVAKHGATQEEMVKAIALLLRQFFGFLTWDAFLSLYTLYLQSIPLAVAKEAWGVNAASASALTHHNEP